MAWVLTSNNFDVVLAHTLGSLVDTSYDHGALGGLADDDHTQYILHSLAAAANDFLVASGANTFVKKTLAETGAILEGDIDHDNLVNYVANKHIDHSGVTIVAGAGLTGGGTLEGSGWTLAVGAGLGIGVNADDIELSHLGFEDMADPGADRIVFWDETYDKLDWLVPNTGLVISGTDLNIDTSWIDSRFAQTPDTSGWDEFLKDLADGATLQQQLDYIDDNAIEVVEAAVAPTTTYAGMIWLDTSQTPTYKRKISKGASGSLNGTTGWVSTGWDTTYTKIEIIGYGLSMSANDCCPFIQMQQADGTWVTVGYSAQADSYNNYDTFASGFGTFVAPQWDAAHVGWFSCTITRTTPTSDIWAIRGTAGNTNGPGVGSQFSGYQTITGGVGGIRIQPYVAAATFDSAGEVAIWVE